MLRTWLAAGLASLIVLACAPVSLGAPWCSPDVVTVTSHADTIFVAHLNAGRNCCSDLTLAVHVQDTVVDFQEGETGSLCYCVCCFNLHYDAHGFAAGHYVVRVWNADHSEMYGQGAVDVTGAGSSVTIGRQDRGACLHVGTTGSTWSAVRRTYR